MPTVLTKLLYVHDGHPGAIGEALEADQRVVAFQPEGSGLIGVPVDPHATGTTNGRVVGIPVGFVALDEAEPRVRAALDDEAPAIVGLAGEEIAVLVRKSGLLRSTASVHDLRGKIRYGLARVGWQLE